ncbi:TniB protein [Mariprofundus aestuarium]|uniref:TniB protein n=1 Tax=Mariprofundus aestuarium TaxID=1921086 RepID=A0A2K8L6U6_MARES|nr:TniB family NTP-binding protein [Mariprofundus aestuarium]ATX80694.1 TniB protein [Mariprofundus aestuarium]
MIEHDGLLRIQQVQEERWQPHPYAVRVLEELELVYLQPKISGAPIGRSIIGCSGAGKTTILKHFVEEHRLHESSCPPLFINTPPGPNLNSLLTMILEEVNDFKPTARTASEKLNRTLRILGEIKPPMIIFDEAQNLAEGTDKQSRNCVNAIKTISNNLGIPTIMAGTGALIPVINYDDQYVRRWRPVKLEVYPECQEFVDLVNALVANIPLKKQEGFLAPTAYQKLHKYSQGVIGLLKEVLINATAEAIRDGSERLTIKHIRPIMEID